MFKLLHFSDAHLGYHQYGFNERLLDFGRALDEVYRIAIEKEVDAIVDTGDTQHSPEPDPLSVAMHRRFIEKCHAAGIPVIASLGNHNYHDVGRQFIERPSWMEAVSDKIIRPKGPGDMQILWSRDKTSTLGFVVADWMPSEAIDGFVGSIQGCVDALFMHQSTEGFMPAIARCELRPAQVDGKARYVGVGDIHICHKLETAKGTIIGSTGSTELGKSDEPLDKYVALVTFPKTGPIKWEKIQIRTRKALVFDTAMSEQQLQMHRAEILKTIGGDDIQGFSHGCKNPLVILPYAREIERQALMLKKELRDLGLHMLKFTAESMVQEDETFEKKQAAAATAMVDIIRELLANEPGLIGPSTDLWNSPENARAILDQLKARIRSEVVAPPPPMPAPGAQAA